MRWLALDHGTKNIGIAFSDELEILASPFAVWPNLGEPSLVRLARPRHAPCRWPRSRGRGARALFPS